jgi:hypothetical protein
MESMLDTNFDELHEESLREYLKEAKNLTDDEINSYIQYLNTNNGVLFNPADYGITEDSNFSRVLNNCEEYKVLCFSDEFKNQIDDSLFLFRAADELAEDKNKDDKADGIISLDSKQQFARAVLWAGEEAMLKGLPDNFDISPDDFNESLLEDALEYASKYAENDVSGIMAFYNQSSNPDMYYKLLSVSVGQYADGPSLAELDEIYNTYDGGNYTLWGYVPAKDSPVRCLDHYVEWRLKYEYQETLKASEITDDVSFVINMNDYNIALFDGTIFEYYDVETDSVEFVYNQWRKARRDAPAEAIRAIDEYYSKNLLFLIHAYQEAMYNAMPHIGQEKPSEYKIDYGKALIDYIKDVFNYEPDTTLSADLLTRTEWRLAKGSASGEIVDDIDAYYTANFTDIRYDYQKVLDEWKLARTGVPSDAVDDIDAKYLRENPTIAYLLQANGELKFDNGLTISKSEIEQVVLDKKISESLTQAEISLAHAQTLASPLVLDTDGNDFETKSKQDGVYFDLDNNGFAEKTAWTSGDAFLTYDLNENGNIDNGGELFGNHTLVGENKAVDGFAALAQYDENADGVIDENDDIYHLMRLWNDDGDGVSEDGEFKTLEEMGVNSIDLNQTAPENDTYTDATVSGVSGAEMADGTSRAVADFWFNVSTADTMQIYDGEFDEDILALPDVRSFGKMPSLRVAMQLDESGVLKELVTNFIVSRDVDERAVLLKEILYKMTGADVISPTSRGSSMNAQDLHVLETMLGAKYYGWTGSPGDFAAAELKGIFNDVSKIFSVLLSYDSISSYLNLIDFTVQNGTVNFDASLFNLFMEINMEQGNDVSFALRSVGDYLQIINNDGDNYNAFVTHYLNISVDNEKYFDFDDSYKIGTNGDDTITGSNGNDKFFSGKGDDSVLGGRGDDTYFFNIGDGKDTITDANGGYTDSDKIVFGEGISSDLTYMTRSSYDLIIRVNGDSEDEITVKNYFSSSGYQIDNITFTDGTEWSTSDISTLSAQIFGTENNDEIRSFTGSSSYSSDQTIYAYDGDDTITGSYGNEKFIAGKGDDKISGGRGNDTYIFNIGDGKDILTDYDYGYNDSLSDKIVFGEGIETSDLLFSRQGNDLQINISGTDDTVTVKNQYNTLYYRIENFQTADGSTLSYTNIDYLIQAMSEFTADTGMTASEAAEENNQAYSDIVNQMWVQA